MIEILDLIIVTYLLIALVSFLFIPRNIVLAKNLIILVIDSDFRKELSNVNY